MSEIRANTVTDAAGTGSPSFPNGLSVASAALTGVPTAPTAAVATNTTQIATTAFVLANVPAAGGMTLLGTLTTTSGTSQTLSGLTLTSYKLLYVSFSEVSAALASQYLQISGGYQLSPTLPSTGSGVSGIAWFDLTSGRFASTTAATTAGSATATSFYANPSITTASTSITFSWGVGAAFDAGSILIYGVK